MTTVNVSWNVEFYSRRTGVVYHVPYRQGFNTMYGAKTAVFLLIKNPLVSGIVVG